MRIAKTIGSKMDAYLVNSCWQHTKLKSNVNLVETSLLQGDGDHVLSAIGYLIHTNGGMSLGMLLQIFREEDHSQILTDDSLIDYAISINNNNISNGDHDENESNEASSRLKALQAVFTVKHYALSRALLFNALHNDFFTLRHCISEENVKLQKQLALDEVLK